MEINLNSIALILSNLDFSVSKTEIYLSFCTL
jgi:hypothetical protein